MSGKLAHPTQWKQRHYNGDGLLIWASGLGEIGHEGIYRATDEEVDAILAQEWDPNNVTDEGEGWILDVAFRNNQLSGFTNFGVGLSTDAALTETDVYAGMNEHGATDGYAGKTVARAVGGWSAPTGTTPTSITTPAAGTHTFSASGTWTAVEATILYSIGLTPNRLIAWSNLSATRSLVNGDTLDVDLDVQAGGS